MGDPYTPQGSICKDRQCLPFQTWSKIIILLLDMHSQSVVHEMKGFQFPFGVLNVHQSVLNKTLVKKRYHPRDLQERQGMAEKVDKLKSISHKNAVNLRSAHQEGGYIDLFYQYVPAALEDAFNDDPDLTVKEIHRQFIELAIFLAKHCIVTTFSPTRCGVVVKEDQTILKYYLPLQQITITDNRTNLERFVGLFNVQSMQHLDFLINQGLNNSFNESISQRTFKNRVKLFPQGKNQKVRKESQPALNMKSRNRKLSNNPTSLQKRKLSTLSKELSEMSQMHKKHKASTRSGGSFNTFQSIISLKSMLQTNIRERSEKTEDNEEQGIHFNPLKRCVSDTTLQSRIRVQSLVARSKRAIESLKHIKQSMASYKTLYLLISQLHQY